MEQTTWISSVFQHIRKKKTTEKKPTKNLSQLLLAYSTQGAYYIPSHFMVNPCKGTLCIFMGQSIFKQDNLVTLSTQLTGHFWASAAKPQEVSSP